MAMGVARCFNISLTQNFNFPYSAVSIADFWRRWHISFSSWLLDYIFKPLQLSLRDFRKLGTVIALMITFLASGIWHGASWCFIAWGGLHGLYLCTSTLVRKPKQRFYKKHGLDDSKMLFFFQKIVTFHLICFSWIFFRASSIHDAVYIIRHSIIDMGRGLSLLIYSNAILVSPIFPEKTTYEFLSAILLIILPVCIRWINKTYTHHYTIGEELSFLTESPHWVKGTIYGFACYLIVFRGVATQSFIYLNF